MFKSDSTISQLLQAIQKGLQADQIGFWIDNQDCYLWENTFHYTNKIKIGNLSMTKERYWTKLLAKLEKTIKDHGEKQKFLDLKFSEISDVELIEELKKRTDHQSIKLSWYPNQNHLHIEGKDIRCGIATSLPIEIKEKKDQ